MIRALFLALLGYDTSPLGLKPNWVTKRGGLPDFVRAIAHALIRDHGFTESHAIAVAISRVKKASGGRWAPGKAHPKTVAKGAVSTARWEAMKASTHAREQGLDMDLAKDGTVTCSHCGRKTKNHVTVRTRRGQMRVYGPDCARKLLAKGKKVREQSEQLTTSFARETPVDLARMDKLLPDAAAVKKASAKLDKLPPALRKKAAARLKARAKELGG